MGLKKTEHCFSSVTQAQMHVHTLHLTQLVRVTCWAWKPSVSTSAALGAVCLCGKSTLKGSSCPSPGKRTPISRCPVLLLSPADGNMQGAETPWGGKRGGSGTSKAGFTSGAGLWDAGGILHCWQGAQQLQHVHNSLAVVSLCRRSCRKLIRSLSQ